MVLPKFVLTSISLQTCIILQTATIFGPVFEGSRRELNSSICRGPSTAICWCAEVVPSLQSSTRAPFTNNARHNVRRRRTLQTKWSAFHHGSALHRFPLSIIRTYVLRAWVTDPPSPVFHLVLRLRSCFLDFLLKRWLGLRHICGALPGDQNGPPFASGILRTRA